MDILFQPDLSYSIDLYTNYPSQYVATKTIAEIIEMCNALTPCDSVIIHKKGGENGYSAVVPLKIGSRSLYHVGSNPLYDVSNKHVILWEYISGIYAGYYYAYDSNHNFIRYNSASFSTKTIDNIKYYYDADGRADDYPPIMYITTDVEHLLINDTSSPNSGGAGSGYIGNSLVSNKKMVGYNVPTSSAESTKTESVNEASESPVSGKPKIGNGYARIKFIKELNWHTIYDHGQIIDSALFKTDHTDEIDSSMSEAYIQINDDHIKMYAFRNSGGDTSLAHFIFHNSPLPSSLYKIKLHLRVQPGCAGWGTVAYGMSSASSKCKPFTHQYKDGEAPLYIDTFIGYSDGTMYFPEMDERDYIITRDAVDGDVFNFALIIMNLAYLHVIIDKIEYFY